MPPAVAHPPLEQFLSTFDGERLWGQIAVRRSAAAFELRHIDDRGAAPEILRRVEVGHLRDLANRDVAGRFRPLKSAPSLVRGWLCRLSAAEDLREALHHLYPGSLPDWWTVVTGNAAPAQWSDVALRQLGQGKILRTLDSAALASVIRVACAPNACLRHRLWQAAGVPQDEPDAKSPIPCLEPCSIWLSFARSCARLEESTKVPLQLAPLEIATMIAALRQTLANPSTEIRAGDLQHPLHPYQITRLLDRHASVWSHASETDNSSHDEA
ncbi:MAG: hypothetical protein IT581_11355 [Verrucomicrobiales bacterium]|nr:hypothetical protein [Verrucomicrobiales bacterium]